MDISVVIPLYNEAESLPELFSWIERVMKEHNYTYEVIFVNDGSTDNSWEVIEELKQRSPHVRGIKFRRNYGKSPGLHCGFQRAKGDVVITMDADLQDSPDEISPKTGTIWYPAGKRKDMTRCLRRSPRNYSTRQLVNSRE